MSYSVRHAGSPRSIDNLTAQQVVEGLQEGLWETTDEVMGPDSDSWVAIENHPQFEEIAYDLEPPPPREHGDETRLDMNPLIDVCLVLLIFFILTTSYAALQKVLDMPGVSSDKLVGPAKMTKEQVEQFTIKVEARQENGKPVVRVEDQAVPVDDLVSAFRRYSKRDGKTQLLLDAQGVDWGTVIAIQDAARGAEIRRVNFLVESSEVK
jgi:biopolymer transport protein ExbD